MGSGKSSVAQEIAARTGQAAIDLDAEIERATGASVAEIFRSRGEAAFRGLERERLRELLRERPDGVFALGGGTVLDAELRRDLLRAGVLVTLCADVDELSRRVGQGQGRPLLSGLDVAERLRTLIEARAPMYAEAHAQVRTSGATVERVADEVLAVVARCPLVVPLGERSYRVEVGAGVRRLVGEEVAAVVRSPGVVLVTDQHLEATWATEVGQRLVAAGKQVTTVVLPPGEEHKTIRSVERIWDAALSAGVDRGGGVLSVGGGVVGDLAGFAAATLLRGVPVGHVPTTLLAMVDSAVGGKTGFDMRQGKNLVGAFHQPSFVLCDVEVLATLPIEERRAGLAEVVKSAWIDGEAAVAMLERDRAALAAGDLAAIERAVRMSAGLKSRIVSADERESGLRAVLNLGHTLGHAIEAAQGYSGMRHGEAVALGMVAACLVAERLGEGHPSQRVRMTELLSALGLPTDVGPFLDPRVFGFIAADKKRRADVLTFVLPVEPGRVDLRPLALAELVDLLA
jgi:shikimate kinase/3-dehydroquinate synthase